jgi:hypothetical protein
MFLKTNNAEKEKSETKVRKARLKNRIFDFTDSFIVDYFFECVILLLLFCKFQKNLERWFDLLFFCFCVTVKYYILMLC